MPPDVPESMNPIPAAESSAARRAESVQRELPPSMTMSPRERRDFSSAIESSTGLPAGIISQTTRGAASFATTSFSDAAPVAPCDSASRTESALRAKATIS